MTRPIPEPDRQRATVGSPEDYVRNIPDLILEDQVAVADMRRGLGWSPEPERFLSAAERELEWRKENGVAFGWFRT